MVRRGHNYSLIHQHRTASNGIGLNPAIIRRLPISVQHHLTLTMSKKTDNQEMQQSPELAKLLLDGSLTLEAKTREELAETANTIIAEANGQQIGAGAVGQNYDNGMYCLTLNIINSKD